MARKGCTVGLQTAVIYLNILTDLRYHSLASILYSGRYWSLKASQSGISTVATMPITMTFSEACNLPSKRHILNNDKPEALSLTGFFIRPSIHPTKLRAWSALFQPLSISFLPVVKLLRHHCTQKHHNSILFVHGYHASLDRNTKKPQGFFPLRIHNINTVTV